MKKAISLILALVVCLSLCACGGGNDTPNTTEATTTEASTAEPPAEEIVYKLGDSIKNDLFKITPSFGVYTFTFGDTTVNATLPINGDYAYDFKGTYEVYSGTILLNWDHGEQMALDYTFDGTTLDVVEFVHGK